MKVLIKAYINKNLGDDLFIYLLTKRYKEIDFYIDNKAKYLDLDNLKYIETSKNMKIFYKILKFLSLGYITRDTIISKSMDYTIIIGGSMFMEKSFKDTIRFPALLRSKYCILGANFGPFNSKKFYKKYFKFFSRADDICFRDKKSCELFKDLSNVRIAPDIVFSVDNDEKNSSNNKTAIISVINCDDECLKKYKSNYENQILKLIVQLQEKGYSIKLMSFCSSEGDLIAINRIYNKITEKKNISIYEYDGNIKNALDTIQSATLIVGSRYHANILGIAFGKLIIPIAYSDKTINSLRYIEYKGPIYDIRTEFEFDTDTMNGFKVDNNLLQEMSLVNFKMLDNKLNGENYDKKKRIN